MAATLPVKGTEISSAPCSIQRAAGLLRRFLSSSAAAEAGLAKGYIETVAQSLDNMLARRNQKPGSGKKVPGSSASNPNYFGQEELGNGREKVQGQEELKISKKKAQDLLDFEALLGNEIENTTVSGFEELLNGDVPLEEKLGVTPMLASTLGPGEVEDDEKEAKKRKKKKKKKSLDGAVKDVYMGGLGTPGKAEADGMDVSTPGPRTVDDNYTDAKSSKKKKNKQLEGALENAEVDSRVREGDDTGVQEGKHKKKTKKRSSEESPGDSSDHPRKSKKLRMAG